MAVNSIAVLEARGNKGEPAAQAQGVGDAPLFECHVPAGDDFLSAEELAALTPAIVIDRVRKLGPAFAENAYRAEQDRRPVQWLWDELRKTGYFYLLMPRKYGGLQATSEEFIDASLPICEGDASTGWTAMFACTHNIMAANMPVEGQEEIFGGGKYPIMPGMTIPPGKARKVEGGYRVTGRWRWATVSHVADWFWGICLVEGEGDEKPTPIAVLMRPGDVTVLDSWNSIGMIATGTHDVVADDVFVPDRFCNPGVASLGGGIAKDLYPDYLEYQAPLLGTAVALPALGCARAALRAYEERMAAHTKRGTEGRQGDRQSSQIRLGEAIAMVEVAETTIRHTARQNIGCVGLPPEQQIAMRTRLRAQITYATQLCRSAVIKICEANGTTIYYGDAPLQRHLRDVMVVTSHIIFDEDVVYEQLGRVRMGLAPNTTLV